MEESYRRATTQGPIIEGGSLVSPGLASQRDRFQGGLSVMVVLSTRKNKRRGGGRVAVRLVLTPQGRQSPGTTRAHELLVHVPAVLWKCWDPSYWCAYQRHCEMLGPEIMVDVPAALCERWAQGFETRAGTSAGQRTRELVGRETVVCVREPRGIFLTRLVPSTRSHKSSTWCRRVWYYRRRA